MADDIILPPNSKAIPLSSGKFAIVDEADYEWLMQWKWHYRPNGYAARLTKKHENPQRTSMMMHRQIMETPAGKETDHINANGLDNRRCNLRICTNRENQRNRRKQSGKLSSPYKGVYLCNRSKKWIAQIMIDKRNKHIGSFDDIVEAAIAYNTCAKELFGEYARFNDVEIPKGYKPKKKKVNSSSYRGVCFHKQSGRWVAKIKIAAKCYWLGMFATEIEAAKRFNEGAIEFGVPEKCNNLATL